MVGENGDAGSLDGKSLGIPIDLLQRVEPNKRKIGQFTIESYVEIPHANDAEAIAEWTRGLQLGNNLPRVLDDIQRRLQFVARFRENKDGALRAFCIGYPAGDYEHKDELAAPKIIVIGTADRNDCYSNFGLIYTDISRIDAEIAILAEAAKKYPEMHNIRPFFWDKRLKDPVLFYQGKVPFSYQELERSIYVNRGKQLWTSLYEALIGVDISGEPEKSMIKELLWYWLRFESFTQPGYVEYTRPGDEKVGTRFCYLPHIKLPLYSSGVKPKYLGEPGTIGEDRKKWGGAILSWDDIKPGTEAHYMIYGEQ